MNVKNIIEYWTRSADEDHKTAEALFSSKRYAHSLFFCHLTIEKMLKALVVKNTGVQAPYEHKLALLADMTGIEFTKMQRDLMNEINAFNIKARYDNYKFEFYKRATKEFSEKYLNVITQLYKWLKQQV